MDWFFNKLDEIRKGGLEVFFLFLSAFCFIDWFSIAVWEINIAEKFSKLTLIEITYPIIGYFCIFYILKLVRFLIMTLIRISFFYPKRDEDYYKSRKEYYYLDDLLEDSNRENNDVKYKNYLRFKSKNEVQNNLKTLVFVTVLMIITDCILSGTVMRILIGYRIFSASLVLFGIGLILFCFQTDNEDDNTNTYIRKEKFKIQE
ncbi:MAG: hypothetical protein EHM93_06860 [Bacteroidales bacterium]|nr:MAG: hypothetical protein EHM93_06860 [Bacteroidales bacterium]